MIQERPLVSLRILIVRLSHLGDCVHALPIFHGLRERYPAARIAWVIQREFQSLIAGLPGLDQVFAFERHSGWSGYARLWGELGRYAADWAIDAQGNGKSASVLLASRATRRSGLARGDWQEPFFSGVLTDNAAPSRGPHALDAMRALLEHVAEGARWRTDLALSAGERARSGRGLGDERAPLVLHLSRPTDIRAWPEELCIRFIEGWRARGERVLCLRGPEEAQHFAELEARFARDPGVLHCRDEFDLRALAALFEELAARGARFVGPDSGPLHLAAASGMRVLCLEGPQAHERTGPRPGHSLRSRNAPACAPCLQRTCSHALGPICMRIEPGAVIDALGSS
jgi:ADP-heptose:LPS heptosyltransferase